MKRNTSVPLAFVVAIGLGSCAGRLQAADPAPEPPEPPVVHNPPPPGQPQNRIPTRSALGPPGGFERVLNEEQREQMRNELQVHRGRFRELDERSLKLRREFQEALFAETLDETAVREKAVAMALADAERALLRARAFAKVRPSLSPEQVEQLKTMSAELPRGPGGPGPGGEPPERIRPPRPPGNEGNNVDPLPRPRPPGPPPPAR